MCGKASFTEDIKGHSVGASSPVICVKPDETSSDIMVVAVFCDVYLAKYTHHSNMVAD